MRKGRYHLLVIISLLVCQEVMACFCISENIETANYSSYEELFLGKILKIERIEIEETIEDEDYELIGTITTFEVIRKWKGKRNRIIEIYQQQNSCGIDFSITNSRWIISAYRKEFVGNTFREVYPNKYLQTDNCSLYVEEIDSERFESDIEKISKKFPNEIALEKHVKTSIWAIILFLGFVFILVLHRIINTIPNRA